MTYHTFCDSPLGPLLLVSTGKALSGIYVDPDTLGPEPAQRGERRDEADPFSAARQQLAEYFAGRRTHFDLPLAPAGTPFQQRVWAELQQIPHGATITYGELARRIGQPNASRAVGLANGRNPLTIIVPCHRVIGAKGKLVGYLGGLDRKRQLLALEASVRHPGLFALES